MTTTRQLTQYQNVFQMQAINFACRQSRLVSRRCEVLLGCLGILPWEASLATPQRKICEGRWALQTMPDNELQKELLYYISRGPGLPRDSNRSEICPYLDRQTQVPVVYCVRIFGVLARAPGHKKTQGSVTI